MDLKAASHTLSAQEPTNEVVLPSFAERFFEKFRSVTKFYSLFHILFCSCVFVQILSVLLFFSFFSQTTWAALSFASIFLTIFSYLVLHFYFQTRKKEQFYQLKEELTCQLLEQIKIDTSSSLFHIQLAACYGELAAFLHEKEASYYTLPSSFITLSPLMQKFSIWLHWKDILTMKELLLLSSISETVITIKNAPLDLQAHARLASYYLNLCQIYLDPRKAEKSCSLRFIPSEYEQDAMKTRFHAASDRAVEELNIISELAPTDLWTHLQLGKVFHDKEMPELEIKAFETLNRLKPQDETFLLRLGTLYFSQGLNAKGMKIYEELRKISQERSEQLIAHYDSFEFFDVSLSSSLQ